jgi:hypothetical protein
MTSLDNFQMLLVWKTFSAVSYSCHYLREWQSSKVSMHLEHVLVINSFIDFAVKVFD